MSNNRIYGVTTPGCNDGGGTLVSSIRENADRAAEQDSSHCGYIIRGRIIASGDGDIGASYIATKPGETSFDII